MIEITSSGPVNRHVTEFLTTTPGVKQYRCKTLQNPDWYFDGKSFDSVDPMFKLDTSTEKAGGLWLRKKGIVSVGTKKSDDAYKLFGLRPDENQGGSESVEWSIESIEINGKAQTINLRDRLEVSPITTKFGDNLYVQRARQRCRIMVPGDPSTESFKVCLRLHLKGCTVTYREDLDEYWIYRNGTFFVRIGKPYLVDPATMNPIEGDFIKHSLVEIGKGEFRYTKEPTPAFALANLPTNYLIDADTVYSSTADGHVQNGNAVWATCRNAATGNYTESGSTSIDFYFATNYYVTRGFLYHVTSGVAGTITAASLFGYQRTGGYIGASDVLMVMLGTQAATLTNNDFSAFSGTTFGSFTWTNNTAEYKECVFNATGIAAINQAGTTKLCVRNLGLDYNDVAPTAQWQRSFQSADDTATVRDPYLYITIAAAAGIKGKVYVSGLPKTISASKIMVGGQWKSISAAKIMVNGQWKSL